MDTFSRRIVGWSAATVKETVFVLDALEMAIWQRDRDQHPVQPGELIHHSDAGAQYTSFRLAEHLDAAGIAEGKTKRKIIRCLKRYVIREVYHLLRPAPRTASAAS